MKNRATRWAFLGLAAALCLILTGGAAASEEVAQREDLVCTACHDKPGSKLLTDRGKYYELMGSLDGYGSLEASFQRCTYCHRRKPGSQKLTRAGKTFSVLVDDMKGLLEWMREQHPPPAEPSDAGEEEAAEEAAEEAGELRPQPAH